ncbi:Stp1/IreP family PP2C-type Ser/Thr phosphatase [Virgibacillus siamensis]|uniref:Stp1/IreP family PP2C-type Ser/Thr phosphatase n=1 Tax=Virgibacillus siamensis TaxID=480071 RepID=UPI0009867704|nr:Stp1/IreP family PP2C-type Ser/Thr phosphatase [Virgibacillus siamensis]
MKGQFLTDTGRVRSHNEDSGGIFYNSAGQMLAVIADGMGGHQAGDVASQMTTELMKEAWEKAGEMESPEKMEKWLSESVTRINNAVYEHAMNHEECFGMGTTIVGVACIKDFTTVVHIGDSRCYILNDDGFKQVTEDHSFVNALVQSGEISKDDAQYHPRKNVVLKALGTESHIEPDVRTVCLDPGNKILLCSDGLTDKVEDNELEKILQEEADLQVTGDQMIDLANERGGEDNISLVLLYHETPEKEGES